MSRLLRGRRRPAPPDLNTLLASAINNSNDQPLTLNQPRSPYPISPRQAQATPLPSPITTITYTTTTTLPGVDQPTTAAAISSSSIPFAAATGPAVLSTFSTGAGSMTLMSSAAGATATASAGSTTTTVTTTSQSNPGLVAGVAGAGAFSFVSLVGFLIVRRRRLMYENADRARRGQIAQLRRDTLDVKRAEAMSGQIQRPYSSRYRL